MVINYRIVVLLAPGSSYSKTFEKKEDRDALLADLLKKFSIGSGNVSFNQDIPDGSKVINASATINVPHIVSIESQDIKISD